MEQPPSNENRILAALGYPIWVIALVVLLTDMKENRFMRVHAIQALGYTGAWVVVFIGLSILTALPFLGVAFVFLWPLLYLAWFVIAVFYAYQAYQGKMFTIPVVSQFTTRYAGTGG